MYSSFSDLVRQKGIEAAADIALAFGCEAVEFIDVYGKVPTVESEEDAREIRRVLDAKGLCVSCYSVAVDLALPETSGYDSDAAREYVCHSAKMAAIVGSPYLHHTLVLGLNYNEKTYERDFGRVMKMLLPHTLAIADLCNSLGLTVLYEPQGVYVNGRENFTAFYNEMKRQGKRVGVCGDMGNSLFCDWRPEEFFDELAPEIKHMHAKDYSVVNADELSEGVRAYSSVSGKRIIPIAFGEGDVDVPHCIAAVRAQGYDGAISLEGEYYDIDREIPLDVTAVKRFI